MPHHQSTPITIPGRRQLDRRRHLGLGQAASLYRCGPKIAVGLGLAVSLHNVPAALGSLQDGDV